MLYREIIAVCSQSHTKHINTLCGQNAEFVNVKPVGIYVVGQLSSRTRHRVLAVAALDKSLSMVS